MTKPKSTSARRDGRGGWPTGKRRHPIGQWPTTLERLLTLLRDHARRGTISRNALAAAVGVREGTVRRWVSREDVPSPEMQGKVKRWVAKIERGLPCTKT
jgi:hypothetical protein